MPPYGVRELAEISSTALGTVSRVVGFLEEEALVTPDEKRRITAVGWPALIARRVRDYRVTESNMVRAYLEPRGLVALGSGVGRRAGTLEGAGFEVTVRPGTWSMTEVQIDFLVPASLGGPGRRGAPLGVHGTEFARKADPLAGDVTRNARAFLQEYFGDRESVGAQMAVRASAGCAIALSCEALARRVLDVWK
jgi:hypothetical protein